VAVLLQYQGTLANIPKYLEPSIERSATLISAYQPESDLIALVERYRTGPFRPEAQVYEGVSHGEFDVVFGIDLRKWAEGGWNALASGAPTKETVPPVLLSLLMGLEDAYQRLANDAGLINLYKSCGKLSFLCRKKESVDIRSPAYGCPSTSGDDQLPSCGQTSPSRCLSQI
jgi:hypothetical protein